MSDLSLAKQFLDEGRFLSLRLEGRLMYLLRLQANATKITTALTGMPRSGGLAEGSSTMENAAVKIVMFCDGLQEEIDELRQKRDQIEAVLSQVHNIQYRVVLELRYLDTMSWQEICKCQHKSRSQIMAIHAKGLLAVQKILKNDKLFQN